MKAGKIAERGDSVSRLLVVEDDPDITTALRLLFGSAGYEVVHAGDGRAGLREAYAAHPDLVVLDVGLPEMDGWAVLERLRDISDVPVLVLTAHGKETDKVRGLRSGADDYLTKPFANAELLARVEALLRRSSDAASWTNQLYDDGVLHLDPTGIGQERVKFAVLRLRRKLGWTDPDTSPIESVRGFGYRYRRP